HRSFEQVRELFTQPPDAEAGVDQQVTVAPADEEQVRLQEGVDVRLADAQDAVVDRLVLEPSLHHTHARDASGLTRWSPPGYDRSHASKGGSGWRSICRSRSPTSRVGSRRPRRRSVRPG